MKDIAKEAYERCEVGGIESISPDSADEKKLSEFQVALRAAKDMEKAGLIHITKTHNESSTSKRFVDLIMFKRLK